MGIEIRSTPDAVDWAALAVVFEQAPLGQREPDKLRRAFEGSYRVSFAYDGSRVVGAARLLSDGEYYAAVYDVVVLPEYQRRGIGSQLVTRLLSDVDVGSTILVAVPGREEFYRGHGFSRLKTAMARYRDPVSARQGGYIE